MWDARHQGIVYISAATSSPDGTGKTGQVAWAGLPWRCFEKIKVGMTNTVSPTNSWKAYLMAGASEPLSRYSSMTMGIISGGTSWSERGQAQACSGPTALADLLQILSPLLKVLSHPGAPAPGNSRLSLPP